MDNITVIVIVLASLFVLHQITKPLRKLIKFAGVVYLIYLALTTLGIL